ncbi:TrxA Thiol-disulfide isomerase and thioredoxins [uncultured Caudovirales phage]|uniref:TrxA Thiol-disulfide isomerase and thioredoxins n=1 Tax=uncultured Caudovirales phage TaxID=2100421 RepID=A0A6J5RTS2_9CAUD|nr:TrxA Thiol-disulfide isomerase and thioredoxins [uncultured Caudovirales phage]
MSDVISVDDGNFESEVINSKLPVLVDFSAPWCGPCSRQLPILEKFAKDNLTKVKVVKIDIDECQALSSKYGIRSVPSLLLFNNGQNIGMKVGLLPQSALDQFVSEKC